MSTPTPPSAGAANPFANIPVDPATGTPSGQAIYDMLMSKIEPDLVTATMATLDEKYKNETPEDRKARGERYKAAFEAYDTAYRAYMDGLQSGVHRFGRDALVSIERDDQRQDAAGLSSLESAMSSL